MQWDQQRQAGTAANLDGVRVRERQASQRYVAPSHHAPPRLQTEVAGLASSGHCINFPENPHFVGRRDILATLKRHLVGRDAGPSSERRAFALWAPRGFGKTQTARRFAAETAGYFDFMLWVQADTETGIIEAYSTYAAQLGLVDDATDFNAATKALRSRFQTLGEYCILNGLEFFQTSVQQLIIFVSSLERRFLVIFDSADDANLINTWWPHGKMGSVLITTLDQSFGTSNVAGNGAQLGTIDEEDAIQMVLSQVLPHARNDADQGRKEASEIVQRVAHLPLAIQNCVGVINESGRTLTQYNRQYRDKRSVLKSTTQGTVNRNYAPYPRGLTDTICDRLGRLDANARALVDVFSLLHLDRIPETLFKPAKPPEDLGEIGFLTNFESCITQVSKGLVSRGEPKKQGDADLSKFFMHSLHHEFIRTEMSKEGRQTAFNTASRLVSLALDPSNYPKDMPRRAVDRKYFLDYFSHAESIRQFCERVLKDDGNEALEIPASFIMLLNLSSWYIPKPIKILIRGPLFYRTDQMPGYAMPLASSRMASHMWRWRSTFLTS